MAARVDGWLWKRKSLESKTRFLGAFNKRFVTLDFVSELFYYSHTADSKKVSTPLPFKSLTGVRMLFVESRGLGLLGSGVRASHALEVQTATRPLEFYCADAATAERWAMAVRRAMAQAGVEPADPAVARETVLYVENTPPAEWERRASEPNVLAAKKPKVLTPRRLSLPAAFTPKKAKPEPPRQQAFVQQAEPTPVDQAVAAVFGAEPAAETARATEVPSEPVDAIIAEFAPAPARADAVDAPVAGWGAPQAAEAGEAVEAVNLEQSPVAEIQVVAEQPSPTRARLSARAPYEDAAVGLSTAQRLEQLDFSDYDSSDEPAMPSPPPPAGHPAEPQCALQPEPAPVDVLDACRHRQPEPAPVDTSPYVEARQAPARNGSRFERATMVLREHNWDSPAKSTPVKSKLLEDWDSPGDASPGVENVQMNMAVQPSSGWDDSWD